MLWLYYRVIVKQQNYFIFIILLLVLGFSSAQEEFFPHRDGLSWTYSNGETQSLSGPHDIDGQEVMVLSHIVANEIVSQDYLIYHPTGVYSAGTRTKSGELLSYNPPLTIYRGTQLKVGQTWQSITKIKGLEINLYSEVTGTQGIKTPVGRFNTLVIRQSTVTSSGGQTTLHLYFVPAVGIVRFVQADGVVVDLVDKNF